MTCTARISRSEWDVVVIGAGPAGAAAALGTARSGLKTLLVDRQSFPRAKVCGGCVNRRSLGILESLGLRSLTEGLPGLSFSALRLKTGRGTDVRLKLPEGMAVTRETFDNALVASATRAGASFASGITARVAADDGTGGDSRQVTLTGPDSDAVNVFGRVVLAADGLGHPSLQGLDEFPSIQARRSRIGLGTVIEGGGEYEAGTIHMAIGRVGYAGVVRVEGGKLDIAVAVEPEYLRSTNGPRFAVEGILAKARMPIPSDFSNATWQGTAPLDQKLVRPAGWRVLAIGDAAGYIEPFTGEGIAWALTDAAAVSPFVCRSISNWTSHTAGEWIRTHRRLVVDRQRLCRAIGAVLRSGVATELGAGLLARFPGLAERSVRRLHAVPQLLGEIGR